MPSDLRPQFDEIGSYLSAAGVPQYCGEGIEADDYIASLARRASVAGWNVVIASSDKDFMQLVSAQIGLLNPNDKTGAVWSHEQVRAKTGVAPEQVADWLALMGDAVDNIPGVAGVGPKTAADLLNQFGSVEALLGRLDEVKSDKLRAALRDSTENVRRNQKLVRLPEVPCDFSPDNLVVRPANQETLRGLLGGWGFKGMTAALDAAAMSEKQAKLI
jgi:DNA polymerase-1